MLFSTTLKIPYLSCKECLNSVIKSQMMVKLMYFTKRFVVSCIKRFWKLYWHLKEVLYEINIVGSCVNRFWNLYWHLQVLLEECEDDCIHAIVSGKSKPLNKCCQTLWIFCVKPEPGFRNKILKFRKILEAKKIRKNSLKKSIMILKKF